MNVESEVQTLPLRIRASLTESTWLPALVALTALVVFFSATTPVGSFLSASNLLGIGLNMSQIGIMAIGVSIVLLSGGIDLSVGGVLAASAVVGAHFMVGSAGDSLLLGVLVALATGLGFGLLNGLLVGPGRLPPLVVTLGSLGIALGCAYLLGGDVGVNGIPESLRHAVALQRVGGLVPMPLIILAVVAIVMIAIMGCTAFGRHTYAIGSNIDAASRAGIRVHWHVVALYAICGLLAGLAGVIDMSRFGTAAVAAHETDILMVVTAAVIGGISLFGGIGKLLGTAFGIMLVGVLTNGLVLLGVSPYYQDIAQGVVLILAISIDRLRSVRRA